jgi:hypothetical protein
VPDALEAIIDRDLFDAVQRRLHENNGRTTPRPERGAFSLSRLLVCGHCGASMN